METGNRKIEPGSWKIEAGSWKMETGSWKMEALGGPWGDFSRNGVALETCLGHLGGLLWMHGDFLGHLGGSLCDFGWPGDPFGWLLGVIWELLGGLWLLFWCFVSENVKL